MKKVLVFVFGMITWLTVVANSAQAGVEVTWESYPTAGLEGYTTYIVSVESDIGGFKYFNVVFETERFNQIRLNGMTTPTQDQNVFFHIFNEDPLHDTQIMTEYGDVEECFIPEGCIVEYDTLILGSQTFRQAYDSRNLAQLVVPTGNTIEYDIKVTIISSGGYMFTGVIPEPAGFTLIAAAGFVLLPQRQR